MKNGVKEMERKLMVVKTFTSLMIPSALITRGRANNKEGLYLKGYLHGRSDERESMGRTLRELLK